LSFLACIKCIKIKNADYSEAHLVFLIINLTAVIHRFIVKINEYKDKCFYYENIA